LRCQQENAGNARLSVYLLADHSIMQQSMPRAQKVALKLPLICMERRLQPSRLSGIKFTVLRARRAKNGL
jgi:hypothetical protein